jgi:hypothetical protein
MCDLVHLVLFFFEVAVECGHLLLELRGLGLELGNLKRPDEKLRDQMM